MKPNYDDILLRDVANKLDVLIRLTALSVASGRKQREQIVMLAGAGLSRHEIAELLDTTPGTVSVVLSNSRKARGLRRSDGKKTD